MIEKKLGSIYFPYNKDTYTHWVSLLGTTQFHIKNEAEDYHFHFGVIICSVHRYSAVLKPEDGYTGIRVSFEDSGGERAIDSSDAVTSVCLSQTL